MILVLLLFTIFSFKITMLNVRHFNNPIILKGKISGFVETSKKGNSSSIVLHCLVNGENGIEYFDGTINMKNRLQTLGKNVTFRVKGSGNNIRVLSINGKKVNSFYDIIDVFAFLYVIGFFGLTVFKIKQIYDKRRL
jgi:hypothetical protein